MMHDPFLSQPGTLETFLALNFRPGDSHCVHIDASASRRTRDAMEGILRCYREKFPGANVFSIRFPIKVFWGSVSILEASLGEGGQSNNALRGKVGAPKAV